MDTKNIIMAEKKEPTITPARSKVLVWNLYPVPAMPNTSIMVNSAPQKEAAGILKKLSPAPEIIARIAPTAEPLEIPKM
jgi:hypothetical protein